MTKTSMYEMAEAVLSERDVAETIDQYHKATGASRESLRKLIRTCYLRGWLECEQSKEQES